MEEAEIYNRCFAESRPRKPMIGVIQDRAKAPQYKGKKVSKRMKPCDVVSREVLRGLAQAAGEPKVSIYLPTHPAGRETVQGKVRLKNMLQRIERELLAQGSGKRQIESLLAPAAELLELPEFWQYQCSSLALFLAPEQHFAYRLPIELPEVAVAAPSFFLKPLFMYEPRSAQYYLITVGQRKIAFYRGNAQGLEKLPLGDAPTSIDEVSQLYEDEKHLQHHVAAPLDRPNPQGIMHGHGDAADRAKKERIGELLRAVNQSLRRLLGGAKEPLVFSGVDYVFSIFRDNCSYPFLEQQIMSGNPEGLSLQELHHKSWELVQSVIRRNFEEAYLKLREADSALKSDKITEVVEAARNGRVSEIFMAVDRQLWGRLNDGAGSWEVHEERKTGDVELSDLAARETLLHGGIVHAYEQRPANELPKIAAIYRYPAAESR